METTKRKVSIPFLIVGGILSGIIGYFVNAAWHQGIEFMEFKENLETVLSYPFRDYYDETTIKAVVIAVFIYAIVMVMYYTSRHNLMPGREYGTARFGNVKSLTRVLKGNKKHGLKCNHRILSQNVRMCVENRKTKLNNNILVIGGSGAKKTFGFAKPNILQLNTSFLITDPKGEILRSEGEMLKKNGYEVKVLNLMDMDTSDGYNPFEYIRDKRDIDTLIDNIIDNTTPKNSNPTDPFWVDSERMLLSSIFCYVWLEMPLKERNIRSVLRLLREAQVVKDKPSDLDIRMKQLVQTSDMGVDHPAYVDYMKVMGGAGDTIRSIIISANARLSRLENDSILRMLDHDDMHFEEMGIGINGDEKTKTALFCLIPDSDKTYNFIVGMLYTQAFQRLYDTADNYCGGELPIHVSFLMDEFANVALPKEFTSYLSTMRSRSISAIIIIQNLAQIKSLFKDDWESVTGNCDTFIYLGGNEQSTHEYVSKMLGKATIEKRSTGESRGRQGSSSRNYDVLGRDLMTPDEIGSLNREKCIIKVAGQFPVIDDKYNTPEHPMFDQSADGSGKVYVLEKKKSRYIGKPFEMLGKKSLAYFEKLRKAGRNIEITTLTYDELMILDELGFMETSKEQDLRREVDAIRGDEDTDGSLEYMADYDEDDSEENRLSGLIMERKEKWYEHSGKSAFIKSADPKGASEGSGVIESEDNETLQERLDRLEFSALQREEILKAVKANIPESYILTYAYPENTIFKLAGCRVNYGKKNGKIA